MPCNLCTRRRSSPFRAAGLPSAPRNPRGSCPFRTGRKSNLVGPDSHGAFGLPLLDSSSFSTSIPINAVPRPCGTEHAVFGVAVQNPRCFPRREILILRFDPCGCTEELNRHQSRGTRTRVAPSRHARKAVLSYLFSGVEALERTPQSSTACPRKSKAAYGGHSALSTARFT